jgi:hypothetical protein
MPVSFNDILGAYHFASADGGVGEHQAFYCKQSGKIYWYSEFLDDADQDELPQDLDEDEDEKYLRVPDKRELGLGKPLALDFAREFLPNDFDKVRQIFSKRGAYARFKDLLEVRRMLNQWNEFEAKAEERALREWCELHSIEVDG